MRKIFNMLVYGCSTSLTHSHKVPLHVSLIGQMSSRKFYFIRPGSMQPSAFFAFRYVIVIFVLVGSDTHNKKKIEKTILLGFLKKPGWDVVFSALNHGRAASLSKQNGTGAGNKLLRACSLYTSLCWVFHITLWLKPVSIKQALENVQKTLENYVDVRSTRN